MEGMSIESIIGIIAGIFGILTGCACTSWSNEATC